MLIHVRLFAILRDRAGTDRLDLNLPEGAQVKDAAATLGAEFPVLADALRRVAYAVNREYASLDRPLATGDEVAVIPAVSGGIGA